MKIFTKSEAFAKHYWLDLVAAKIKEHEEEVAKLKDILVFVQLDLDWRLEIYHAKPWWLRLIVFKPKLGEYDTEINGVSFWPHDDENRIRFHERKLVELHRIEKSLDDEAVEYIELTVQDLNDIGY